METLKSGEGSHGQRAAGPDDRRRFVAKQRDCCGNEGDGKGNRSQQP